MERFYFKSGCRMGGKKFVRKLVCSVAVVIVALKTLLKGFITNELKCKAHLTL